MKRFHLLLLLFIAHIGYVIGQSATNAAEDKVIIWCNGQSSELTPEEVAVFRQQSVYRVSDVMPSFEGGEDARVKYLTKTFKYPVFAMEQNIRGTIITKDGCIANPTIINGLGSGCDEEALRVVRQMPRWNPGMFDGENVAIQYKMKLNINLQ
jgi:protein TonB